MENIALAAILVPFAGALLVLVSKDEAAKWIATLFSALATLATIMVGYAFLAGGKVALTVNLLSFSSINLLGLTIDRLSTLIAVAVVSLGFLIVLYSTAYLSTGNREHPHKDRPSYYAFMLVFVGAMAGLVYSSTMLGQLVFFEITGGCSWALIGYYQSPKSLAAGLKALLITHFAALGLYVAASYLFASTGSFSLASLATLSPNAKIIVFLGILLAAWGKSAQFPLHIWLPDAMEAPTPVSAYLHAASMVKVGVYIFARAIFSAGQVPEIIGWIGGIMAAVTLIYGFVMFLPQKDMKRLLAYSTITQVSFVFLGLSMSIFGSKLAFDGAVAHIFNHAFAKSLFFLVAGALAYTTGTRLLPALRGMLRASPLLGVCFCIAALSITGVPPFNGFFSKFAIFSAGFQLSSEYWLMLPLTIVALLESIASFAWFMMWFGKTVPGEPSEVLATASPVPPAMKIVLITLVVMCLASSVIAFPWLE